VPERWEDFNHAEAMLRHNGNADARRRLRYRLRGIERVANEGHCRGSKSLALAASLMGDKPA
jgi:hypothetical protein